ncbi:MAG: protein kinase [Polyangiaceae bacterium]|nr:protein kinase [Polyangiaceae bacterium]
MGRYELVDIIGGGGFATVWRARTAGPGGFERSVAVKVIRPGRANQKRFQDMLLDEARLVARIQHPNVAQIWEVGEDPRSLYVVMELVDGVSLDELRYRAEELGKSLSVRAIFRILADACAGLHAAHELASNGAPLGLVHRDVSPQNILVSRDGIAKLIDFGIAKARERLAGDTTTGFIKGKISFMAPEQARAEETDRRADIWAMGAVAFDLVMGRPPFDGQSELGRLAALVAPDPAPPLSDDVPAPLRAVVAKALSKDREARHSTALELKEAIEEALIESELETSPSDVARLCRPYFGDDVTPEKTEEAPSSSTAERPVSSTIEAAKRTETIELPMGRFRHWPVIAGLAVMAPLVAWAVARDDGRNPSDAASTTASVALESVSSSQAPPPRVGSEAPAVSVASPTAIGTASAREDASPAATATPTAPSAKVAPPLQRRPSTVRRAPSAPVIDDNAIE